MRILFLIDHLCSGGAQRQMTLLAIALKKLGHDVAILVYFHDRFFEDELAQHNITIHRIQRGKISRILPIRTFIRRHAPDALIAYLDTPSLLAELSGLPTRKYAIIVSERTGKVGKTSVKDKVRLRFHYLADAVVTNAVHLKEFVVRNCPGLESRVHVIHNCVDTGRFSVADNGLPGSKDTFDIVTVGRYSKEKNPDGLCEAMSMVRDSAEPKIRLTWYGDNFIKDGRPSVNSEVYLRLKERIEHLNLNERFVLKSATKDIVNVFNDSDAVCLASFYEGFSNVLGEAVACGKPVLASNVCDNPILVRHGENGFLFDPNSPADIADSFLRIARLSSAELHSMSRKSQSIAEEVLSPERFVNSYLELIRSVASKYQSVN